MSDAPLCSTCKFFEVEDDRPYGWCRRWNAGTTGYADELRLMPLNEVLIRTPKRTGAKVGPLFGCVLHQIDA